MSKRVYWIIGGVLVVAFLMFASYQAGSFARGMQYIFRGHQTERAYAMQALYKELAFQGCVPVEAVVRAFEAREWSWQPSQTGPDWCAASETLTGWLAVRVEPELAFSTDAENTRYFGFDAQGCLAEWESTC